MGNTSVKTIVNCYGHGGWGWTTLFGSVQYAIELFEKTNPSKDIPIRVIGWGVWFDRGCRVIALRLQCGRDYNKGDL